MRVIWSYTAASESQIHLRVEGGKWWAFLRGGWIRVSPLSVCGCSRGGRTSLLVWLDGGDSVAPADTETPQSKCLGSLACFCIGQLHEIIYWKVLLTLLVDEHHPGSAENIMGCILLNTRQSIALWPHWVVCARPQESKQTNKLWNLTL